MQRSMGMGCLSHNFLQCLEFRGFLRIARLNNLFYLSLYRKWCMCINTFYNCFWTILRAVYDLLCLLKFSKFYCFKGITVPLSQS